MSRVPGVVSLIVIAAVASGCGGGSGGNTTPYSVPTVPDQTMSLVMTRDIFQGALEK